MNNRRVNQGNTLKYIHESELKKWIEAFLIDSKVQNLSYEALHLYEHNIDELFFFYAKILHSILRNSNQGTQKPTIKST